MDPELVCRLVYHRPLLRLPALCDGCGSQFSTGHALDCRKGGLVIQRHNEIRDALGDLASNAYKEVVREPVVREPNDREKVPALVADLSVRGVWQPQATTFFDVRVVIQMPILTCIVMLEQFFPRLSTLRNKNTHKLLKQLMHLLHHLL